MLKKIFHIWVLFSILVTTPLNFLYAEQSVNIPVKNFALEKGAFPKNFQWMVTTSSTQSESSSENNTWSPKYLTTIPGKENLRTPHFGCHSWQYWQDDIDKVAYLGCNAYRFSIEWSRVQPYIDNFDEEAINHYVMMVKYCKEQGIEPMVCLHHYSDPIWFMQSGGFTQEENILLFTQYCQKIYAALCPYVHQWIVMSQPVAYALKSYKIGSMPPFLKNSGLEDKVILNLFKAHMQVYDMMHETYLETRIGLKPQVGICHQLVQMKPARWYHPLDNLASYFADRLNNQTLLRFFSNGHFQTLLPGKDIAYDPYAPAKIDFFALSYYSPLSFTGMKAHAPAAAPELQAPDNFRVIDKEGLYDAITKVAQFGRPIYIVENGINTYSEEQRILLLNSYLSAISYALEQGYDIRSYGYWTLMDSYEWTNPSITEPEILKNSHFGFYKNRVIDQTDGTLDQYYQDHALMLKQGGYHYKAIITQQQK